MSLKTYLKRGFRYILHGVPNKIIKAEISTLSPNERLKDKRILITGGGRGLGFAFAKKCVDEGAKVVITSRNEDTLKKAQQELGDHCRYIQADVCDIDNFKNLITKASELVCDNINCLILNAGISLHEGNFRNVSEEQFDMQMNTNLKANYFLAKEFIGYLEHNNMEGHLLFVSSERGMYKDTIPYGLTKAAINSLTQGLASDVISSGIRVNAIAPGVTVSDMTGYSKEDNLYAAYQAAERVYLPEEVAEVACFLLSDASKCISGEIIVCDNGRYIKRAY